MTRNASSRTLIVISRPINAVETGEKDGTPTPTPFRFFHLILHFTILPPLMTGPIALLFASNMFLLGFPLQVRHAVLGI